MVVVNMGSHNMNRALHPKDVNFLNNIGPHPVNLSSPNKKERGLNGGGQVSKANEGAVEKIQVTIPNPHLVINSSG